MHPFTLIEQEIAYTTWEDSCKEPAVVGGEPRECRRQKNHDGVCASGFTANQTFKVWVKNNG
jgi:hypothetical protein